MPRWRAAFGLSLFLLATAGGAASSAAEKVAPLLLRADSLEYDAERRILTARGHVELSRAGRVLTADGVSYDRDADTVAAFGDVRLHEPSGEVLFADRMMLGGDLKDGVIDNLRVLLTGDARLAATAALREGGVRSRMERAVYSPCPVCREDPDAAPFWQLKAGRVTHDEQARRIYYHNARLEIAGVPVAYLPYLSHPDPTVKRETGFLPPRYGSLSAAGGFIRLPFFWAPAPDVDLTLEPILTQRQGPLLFGEYRQRFDSGDFSLAGSIASIEAEKTLPDGETAPRKKTMAHLDLNSRFDLDESWRWGAAAQRTTAAAYLNDFTLFGDFDDVLTSRLYAERFTPGGYSRIEAYDFQDLRLGTRPDQPLLLPLLEHNLTGRTDQPGGRWSLQLGARGLARDEGGRSGRLSLNAEYAAPVVADAGYVLTPSLGLYGDIHYLRQTADAADATARESGYEGVWRLRPRVGLDWRYPFIRRGEDSHQLLTPVVALFAAPKGGNPADIPNEDSLSLEQDDTNLFSVDSLPGSDRVEGGLRLAYGVKAAHYDAAGRSLELFLGQGRRLTRDAELTRETGLEYGASDIFGRLDVTPDPRLNLEYRFRLDAHTGRAIRQEAGGSLNLSGITLSGSYLFINDKTPPDPTRIDQLTVNLDAALTDAWSTRLYTTLDLEGVDGRASGVLANGLRLVYDDSCFAVAATYHRAYLSRITDETSSSFSISLIFKTLGDTAL